MASTNWIRSLQMLLLGAMLGGLFVSSWGHSTAIAQQNNPQANPATMQADVAHLKDLTPPHSHPMVEVGMFAANLWFAGRKAELAACRLLSERNAQPHPMGSAPESRSQRRRRQSCGYAIHL